MLSSLQLARLVQDYLAAPGASVDEKAALVGVRRNVLLRAARGTISRTARARLLAHFATTRAQPARARAATPRPGPRKQKRGFT
jgi:hypothetical protein